MVAVNLKSLVSKLNSFTRGSLEAAAGLCLSRTHYNIEIEHWMLKLIEAPGSDIAAIARHFEVDASRLTADFTRALDRMKTGNSRPPALAPDVVDLARQAWLLASVEFGAGAVRSGHLLLALLSDDTLRRLAHDASDELKKITPETLRQELPAVTAKSDEAGDVQPLAAGAAPGAPARPGGPTKTPSLDQFTVDLTARARAGGIDPILGRDAEIRQIVDILTRRRQNNPILTGEAGVGKTAVVEGFALRIVQGDLPETLRNVTLRTLDLGLLQAGAGMKGEFENRLKSVINEVKASPTPIIIFIDEAHTMIGAGGQAGQGDAANLLKPALARGELRTIAATTWAEYKKYFERDPALARRFQVVKVEEPSESSAIEMMRGLAGTLEAHHQVRVLNEAVVDSVRLSKRYISGRQLPDKSVGVLDTACARVGISQTSTPAAVEDGRRRIEQIDVAVSILEREETGGTDHADRIAALVAERGDESERLAALEVRWAREKQLSDDINELHTQLGGAIVAAAVAADTADTAGDAAADGGDARDAAPEATEQAVAPAAPAELTDAAREDLVARLGELQDELAEVQGEEPLVHVCCDGKAVAAVIADWTGIPVGRMVGDEIRAVLELSQRLGERVIGQDHALDAIAQSIRTSRAGLTDPSQPIGVFLMCGTSGVGKTETAVALAEELYGGVQNMTVINMSEFKEEHKVSLLMGSPPGYVGYGEGGVLTEAVRRRPYSVVLLDEMEKAHPGVQDIFYQVFDKGSLRDGEGRDIDFKNTVVIMTSNAGTDAIMSLCADPDTMPDADGLAEALHPELLKTFKPAFLGRVKLVPYFPLGDDVMRKIIELKLGKVGRRVAAHYGATFEYSPEVVSAIASRCTEVDTGARNVDHILKGTVLPAMSAEFLARMAEGVEITRVSVSVDDDGGFRYSVG